MTTLDAPTAARLAAIALPNVEREYPNKLDHVMTDAADVLPPRVLHPAFYGSYDWHSSVHMHWLLARCRRLCPTLPQRAMIDSVFERHFAPEAIAAEVAYVSEPHARGFERTYGWAWLLKLADEIRSCRDADARRWGANLVPLAEAFVARFLDYLPRARYPLRYGMHANSAFGLAFALDHARAAQVAALEALCIDKARAWYGADRDVPASWEPSGADFLSPALIEADLMRRVLAPKEFAAWLAALLPGFAARKPPTLFTPVEVTDRSDAQIVHLDGLNLSRVWCLRGMAAGLPRGDPRVAVACATAQAHLEAGLAGLNSGEYVGEHWLATFAALALSEPAVAASGC